jgi:hypothetical protein
VDSFDEDFAGPRIAVNRAATRFACDVWACGDAPAVRSSRDRLVGRPRLLCTESGLGELKGSGEPWLGAFETFESLFGYLHPEAGGTRWSLLTCTAAIVYAAARCGDGADIELFGSDLAGTEDFDGVEAGGNRSDDRWLLELRIIARLRDVLSCRGVRITRMGSKALRPFNGNIL